MKTKHLIIFILLAGTFSFSFSQILQPVKWSFDSKKINDNEAEIIFKAAIDDKWHLYSQFIGDGGPIPTSFHFDLSPALSEGEGEPTLEKPSLSKEKKNPSFYELVGKVKEEGEMEEAYDPNFEMDLKWFNHEAIFIQKIKILTGKPFTITGYLEFMCCDDKRCLPPEDIDFEFQFNGQITASNEVSSKESIVNDSPAIDQGNRSLWVFFFISILAGFAAVLTPCVFPMIPMTVTFFMQGSENRARAVTKAIIYGISIIIIYTAIGLIVAATLGPGFINWLSTHWLPNIFFFLLFALFAASFFGMFEIILPGWIVNKSDKQVDKGGYLGTFFMALTLVLVSFSCTAPLIGGLLVEAATGEVIKPVVGMFGFSLAFAFPFTILAFFPSWLSKLPKSGGWLNSIKVVLGFIILALGMKFLIIPDQTYHWGILDREIYLAIWIVIFTLMGLYLLGKIKLAHDSDMPYISVPRLGLAIITFAFVLYLIPGLFGAPLKAISGLLPPASSHDFDLKAIIGMRGTIPNRDTLKAQKLCDNPKYSDFLHFPLGLQGYFDYEQGMACAKKLNKPVFLDFNGHGCANCKDMEANVWSEPEVLKRLREDFVLIALYVDDKKELPEEDWITSTFDGKVKKTIGKKFADFQITRFKVNSQPFYVLLDHNEELLTQPLGRVGLEEFIAFLDKGKEEFIKRTGDR
ncbi:MAG: cytochrome c biogenesis protein CcdA [Bacteroidota bacterium]